MLKKIQDTEIKKQTVVLRLDLNVPYSNGKSTDTSRIEKTKETIYHLIKNENKVVILSHFGRPNGKINKDLSLRKLLGYLNEILNLDIKFLPSLELDLWRKEIEASPFPSIFLLENVRFSKLEELNDPDFSSKLASLGNVY